jgi:hypothetical protein
MHFTLRPIFQTAFFFLLLRSDLALLLLRISFITIIIIIIIISSSSSSSSSSRDIAVAIATRLRAGRSGGRVPVEGETFSLLQNRPDRLWGPLSLLYNGYRGTFQGLRRPKPKLTTYLVCYRV